MNFNQVQIAGRLTKSIELRYLPSGAAVASFSVAINRTWKDKQTGEKREEVSFIDCEAFGKTGEILNQYLSKGDPVFLAGRLRQDTWQTQDGQNRSKLKVIVNEFQFVGGKGDGNQRQGGQQQPGGYEKDMREPVTGGGGHEAVDDSDIPF